MFDPILLILGLVTGLLTGLLAGLFGIGGGVVLVPVFSTYFLWRGVAPDLVMHLALATSLSCIVITAAISAWTHHRHQAVDWRVVIWMSPALMLGSALAAWTGLWLTGAVLSWLFLGLMVLVAGLMLFDVKQFSQGSLDSVNLDVKQSRRYMIGGTLIGYFSGLMAIGGGALNVPFLVWQGSSLRHAIGSAAAMGWPLACAATGVYVVGGWSRHDLPSHTWGYVYWPVTLVICLGAALSVVVGARLTHRLPLHWLRPLFVLLLLGMAGRMVWSIHTAST